MSTPSTDITSSCDASPAVQQTVWQPGSAPVAVVMISLNEGHNLDEVCANLKGWAQEVWLVDSYSKDDTVGIALRHGVRVVQRKFKGFGDQWNFALGKLPIRAPWVMKLDPDERLTDELKRQIEAAVQQPEVDGLGVTHRLWFMNRPLPVRKQFVRVWRSGKGRFTQIEVNEHLIVDGHVLQLTGEVEHRDSPSLEHWLHKQNKYTTQEAIGLARGGMYAVKPRFFGGQVERRMWLKRMFFRFPFRYQIYFLQTLLQTGAWRAGRVGFIWSALRTEVMRLVEYKALEIKWTGKDPAVLEFGAGAPDPRVPQYEH
jgi:glycosyltransferase involved in cell wall biosynthesis